MSTTAARPGRRRGFSILRATPALFVLIEVLLLVLSFRLIGWWTLLVLLGISALGLMVIAGGSRRTLRDVNTMRRTGQVPERGAGHAVMTLIAGVLLFVPGYLSGLLGLFLLLPPVQTLARRLAGFAFTRHVLRSFGIQVHPGAGQNLYGDVVDGTRADGAAASSDGVRTYDQVPRQVIEGRVVDPPEDSGPGRG